MDLGKFKKITEMLAPKMEEEVKAYFRKDTIHWLVYHQAEISMRTDFQASQEGSAR